MSANNALKNVMVGVGVGLAGFLLGTVWSSPTEVAERSQPEEKRHEDEKELDYSNIGFSLNETNGYVSHKWSIETGKWDDGEFVSGFDVTLHIMAGAFHYGQTLFEGFKAFQTKSGRVAIFYMDGSCERMKKGCRRLLMPEIPTEVFKSAAIQAVQRNIEHVPPYGSGAALYLRPVSFASGAALSAKTECPEYMFNVLVSPVGEWIKGGLKGTTAVICEDYDRAAPKGVGGVKAGGNYATAKLPSKLSRDKGFQLTLFLDAQERKYIEEFSTSNFIAIDKDGNYVTPKSDNILESNTNRVLQQLARDNGIQVEIRQIPWEEVPTLNEVASCGTAMVMKPIESITKGDQVVEFGKLDILEKLYHQFRAVQIGEQEDKHNWLHYVQ